LREEEGPSKVPPIMKKKGRRCLAARAALRYETAVVKG
jgi:hypothetical protein